MAMKVHKPMMSDEGMEIVRHALGLEDGSGVLGRNHYVASGHDVPVCRQLVASGFMRELGSSALSGGDPMFTVTWQGIELAREVTRKPLTPAQQRYRQWLRFSDVIDITFGQWLRSGGKDPRLVA